MCIRDSHYIDASTLKTPQDFENALKSYSVFGRVTPQQKKEMVLALKRLGHTVAMSGDGVNDVLAFKEADCSIAMAAGSDVAKNVANLVLLDNNFSAMPHIVNEGRRVINNITTVSYTHLVVIDYQNDFVSGSLGFEQAKEVEDYLVELITKYHDHHDDVIFTYDTHYDDYLNTCLLYTSRCV